MAMSACPKVWIIDTSALPPRAGVQYSVTLRVEFDDGKRGELTRVLAKDAEPIDLHISLYSATVGQKGWKVEKDGPLIILREAGGKPFRRVAVESDGPKPIVRWEVYKPRQWKSYVEFDFAGFAPQAGAGQYSLTLTVSSTEKDVQVSKTVTYARQPKLPVTAATVCARFDVFLRENRFDASVVDGSKLRVYGCVINGKLVPATKGTIESPDLKPEELPKVKSPQKG